LLPCCVHQCAMESQQNSLVSVLVFRCRYPSLRARSYKPCGISLPCPALGKSWSTFAPALACGSGLHGRSCRSTPFFFVSMLITGSPLARYPALSLAMFSNWALRSGCAPIDFFLACLALTQAVLFEQLAHHVAAGRRARISARRRLISRRDKLVHSTPCRIGSPAAELGQATCKNSHRAWQRCRLAACVHRLFFEPGLARDHQAAPAPSILGAPSWHPGQTGLKWR